MNYPWMIVAGAALVGWIAVEALGMTGRRVPMPMNFMSAIAFALIAAGVVL